MKHKELVKFEKGALFTFISAASVSLTAVCAKLGMTEESVPVLMFLRFSLGFILLLPFAFYSGFFRSLSPQKNQTVAVLRVFCMLVSQYSMFLYLSRDTVINATLFWFAGPLFVPLLGKLLYGHAIRKITWISIGISFLGVLCILRPDKGVFDIFSLYGLLIALGMAFSQVLNAKNAETETNMESLFFFLLFSALGSFLPLLFMVLSGRVDLLQTKQQLLSGGNLSILLILGMAFFTLANQLFRGIAYRYSTPSLLAPFLYLAIIVSGLSDWLIFNNLPSLTAVIGMGLILLGSLVKWYFMQRHPH